MTFLCLCHRTSLVKEIWTCFRKTWYRDDWPRRSTLKNFDVGETDEKTV